MTTKEHAKRKIGTAERASKTVFAGMGTAIDALNEDVSFNGFGIIRDPYAVRHQLEKAEAAIQAAKLLLAGVEWPSVAEYDQF